MEQSQKHKNANSVHSNCALSTQVVHKIHKSVRSQIPIESVCVSYTKTHISSDVRKNLSSLLYLASDQGLKTYIRHV